MIELKMLAVHAARRRIRGRSFKRNSLLKPLDFILDDLDRCPDTQNPNEIEFVKTSSKGLIFEHVKRVAKGVHEQDIYDYVDLFFDGVLKEAHHSNVNRLLQRERSIRSAYLVYMREELAKILVSKGKAGNADEAMQAMDEEASTENDSEEGPEKI
jgi:hypothetical protein